MIHIVTRENAAEYTELLEEMYRWRHRIYVEQRGWKAIARSDGREIDQFDTDNTVYLLALDDAGNFTGSVRFNPTHQPTLFSEIFPHLISRGEVPRSSSVWEMMRLFVVPNKRQESGRSPVLEELYAGMMEWAIAEKVESIIVLAEVFWLPRCLKMGWVVDPLGLPTVIEGEYWVPMRVEVGEHILAATRQTFQLPHTSVIAKRIDMQKAS